MEVVFLQTDGVMDGKRTGLLPHRRARMEHYAGMDVSLDNVSVCVVDGTGKILLEAKVASEPAALVSWFRKLDLPVARIGMEAGPL